MDPNTLLQMRPGAFQFSEKWRSKILALGETGMGYVIVSVTLKDGRRFDQAVIGSGILSRVRRFPNIPFTEDDVADIVATHEKWDRNEKP